MNWLAAKAEMAVRLSTYSKELEHRECVDIVVNNFFNKLEERTKKQIEDRKRMMRMAAKRQIEDRKRMCDGKE
jgi:hypothetical protein